MLSCKRHLWYLTQELIPLVLFDETASDLTRFTIASKLWQTTRPKTFPPGKPKFPVIKDDMPYFYSLIGPKSWIIFYLLGLHRPQEWMQLPVEYWSKFEDYRFARDYLVAMEVTNDSAERGIKLISDFKDMVMDEHQRDCLEQAVEEHRRRVPSCRKNHLENI